MSQHDFSNLYAKYPEVISQMPRNFTSHEFILELSRQNQRDYIEALYSYRSHLHRGTHTPFMIVHGILAQNLMNYPKLVVQVRKDATSKDIFGQDSWCSEWRQIR